MLLDNQIFKILKASKKNSFVEKEVGQIVSADKNGLVLQLKDGQVNLLEVQKQGKGRMSYKDFVNGNKNILNQILK